ncbi:MAG: hypothetical protein ACXW1Z_14175 [Methylobacter sp.]
MSLLQSLQSAAVKAVMQQAGRCKLDLPGFKNLEGLHIGMFLSAARGNEESVKISV